MKTRAWIQKNLGSLFFRKNVCQYYRKETILLYIGGIEMLSLVLIGLLIGACNMCEKQKKKEDLINAIPTWDKWEREANAEECAKYGIKLTA